MARAPALLALLALLALTLVPAAAAALVCWPASKGPTYGSAPPIPWREDSAYCKDAADTIWLVAIVKVDYYSTEDHVPSYPWLSDDAVLGEWMAALADTLTLPLGDGTFGPVFGQGVEQDPPYDIYGGLFDGTGKLYCGTPDVKAPCEAPLPQLGFWSPTTRWAFATPVGTVSAGTPCSTGKLFDVASGTCKPFVPWLRNCDVGTNSGACLRCNAGRYSTYVQAYEEWAGTTVGQWCNAGCDTGCKECFGPTASECLSCNDPGQFASSDGTCTTCDASCQTCRGTATTCTACAVGKAVDPTTWTCADCGTKINGATECYSDDSGAFFATACGEGFVLDGAACTACDATCKACSAAGESSCTACNTDRFLNRAEGTCVNPCPGGFYGATSDQTCQACNSRCEIVSVKTCPPNFYKKPSTWNSAAVCEPCMAQCVTCVDGNSCLTCNGGQNLYLVPSTSQCVYYFDCPPRTYPGTSNICRPCSPKCATCTTASFASCTSCDPGKFLSGTVCVTTCPTGKYEDESTNTCVACGSGLWLTADHQCVTTCPPKTYKYPTVWANLARCSPCVAPCQDCSSSRYCLSCLNGLTPTKGVCPTSRRFLMAAN
ncbi:hypothetical protein Rsub_08444 [Raphidocelis subcapitata]|uniref:EGF-like domain-containing protein n=1 Tax=Raphidocelis subcapitata TaxID=307507 RepID=A0A2V0PD72_9CHLO|nr:hypothetical protein Rsub_08444 [Raphidocelis subcapitata]|eukprot:GBF95853.1 hypothetical protein Rsub_08444 [Raphidocelis subcapitata]